QPRYSNARGGPELHSEENPVKTRDRDTDRSKLLFLLRDCHLNLHFIELAFPRLAESRQNKDQDSNQDATGAFLGKARRVPVTGRSYDCRDDTTSTLRSGAAAARTSKCPKTFHATGQQCP